MKNILAYVESINGNIKRSAFEVATTAAKLKSKTNSLAIAAIINGTEEIANQLFDYGINQVINIESDILKKYSAQGIAKAVYQLAINKDVIYYYSPQVLMGSSLHQLLHPSSMQVILRILLK